MLLKGMEDRSRKLIAGSEEETIFKNLIAKYFPKFKTNLNL